MPPYAGKVRQCGTYGISTNPRPSAERRRCRRHFANPSRRKAGMETSVSNSQWLD